MRIPPQARRLHDGRRLHLQHGPIDLVVEAVGLAPPLWLVPDVLPCSVPRHDETRASSSGPEADGEVSLAYRAATLRFATVLDELCAELPLLRQRARPDGTPMRGVVARRMWDAVRPFAAGGYITPMAAVAGAVAEEVLAAMLAAAPLRRAAVNNGGDIALHLAPGESLSIGLVDRPDRNGRPNLFGRTTLRAEDGIQGIATSGWRGRSFSLGIADAVTILARTAARADAAATTVANAVDLPGHPGARRVPARDVQADSDLGAIPVTRSVDALSRSEVEQALARGVAEAEKLMAAGLIDAAALHLQGTTEIAARTSRGEVDSLERSGRQTREEEPGFRLVPSRPPAHATPPVPPSGRGGAPPPARDPANRELRP